MEQKTVHFQTIQPNEYDELAAMAREIWVAHYPSLISMAQIEYMLELMYSKTRISQDAQKGYQFEWICSGETKVGFMAYILEGDDIFLSKLYVLIDEHSKGYGKVALERLETIAQNTQKRSLYLYVNKGNLKAMRAYERFGMVQDEDICNDIGGGFVMDDYVMRKHYR